jgi:hypothetical protein
VREILRAPALAKSFRFRVVAGLLVAAAILTFSWSVLFQNHTFSGGDLSAYYRPAKSLIASLARASGGVPEWNPFFASGQPFAGNPEHEIFHPLTTLFFLLPFELAFALQVILPLLVAVGSMFFLLRTLRRSQWASLMGALSWAFGGYLLSNTMVLPSLFGAAVAPLILAFVLRLLRGSGLGDLAGLSLCVGWQCLTGEPSILLAMTLPVLALFVLQRSRLTLRTLLLVGAGVVLGVAVGAASLVPGFEHAGKTIRAVGLPDAWASIWSMPPLRGFDLLSPNALGHPHVQGAYWGLPLYQPRPGPFLASLYPGLLATVLAGAACFLRFRRLLPWLALALIGYLLSLGRFFPLWGVLHKLPLFSGTRFPEKFALLLVLPLVIASAYGFDYIVRGPARPRGILVRILALQGGVAALVAVTLSVNSGWFANAQLAAVDALRVAVVALAIAAILALRRRLGHPTLALVLVVALTIDVVSAGKPVVPTQDRFDLNAPPVFLRPLLASQRDQTIFHWVAWLPGVEGLLGIQGIANPPIPAQWGLAMTLEVDFDLTQLRWTFEGTDSFWGVIREDRSLAEPLLRRRGVTAVVQASGGGSQSTGTAYIGGRPVPIQTVALRDSQPFVFAAHQVEIVDGNQGWETAVRRLRNDVADTACVDSSGLRSFPGSPAPADLRMVARTPGRIDLDVLARGPGPSFLAINQTWDSNWRARIDGVAASLLRTEISLSGLVVPPGRHSIVIEYRNPWLTAGMFTSALALAICLALILLARRHTRATGKEPATEVGVP